MENGIVRTGTAAKAISRSGRGIRITEQRNKKNELCPLATEIGGYALLQIGSGWVGYIKFHSNSA